MHLFLLVCGVLHIMDISLFQSLLNMSPNQRKDIIQSNHKESGTTERLAPATLKEYSLQYFRYLEILSILLHIGGENTSVLTGPLILQAVR